MDQQKIKKKYHTLIIGGGIVGAGALRELSLRGQSALLLEKGDFSSQTSQASSKMLHGGIRYLENFDFGLVREALAEKNLWTKIAPRLTEERMFFIPVYKESKWPLFFVRIGLFIYDLLSGFKNPKRQTLNAKKTMEALPGLKKKNLRGAGVYSDAVVEDSKLALECIYDALAHGGHALNYHEVVALEKQDHAPGVSYVVKAIGTGPLSSKELTIECENIIICAGPFTDQLMKKLKIPWEEKMILSKGSHIWIKQDSLNLKNPMVLQTSDNRVIFVIPQRGAILVGTTEKALPPNANLYNIRPSEEEIQYLLNALNQYFPEADIQRESIISSFAGVRPLVAEPGKERGKVSRHHQIYSPLPRVHVIIGGKYTTFRIMAEDVVERVCRDSNIKFKRGLSARALTRPSSFGMNSPDTINDDAIKKIAQEEMPRTLEDFLKRRLSSIDPEQYNQWESSIDKALKARSDSEEL